jgi:hypothetical protein
MPEYMNLSYEFRVRPIAGNPEMLAQSEGTDFTLEWVNATDPAHCPARAAANGAFYSGCRNNRLRPIAKDWNADRAMPLPESTSFNEFGTIGLSRPQKNLKVPHLQVSRPKWPPLKKSVPFTMWSKCN